METIIEATLAERGQVVIPNAVRDRMGLTPGAKLNFVVDDDGNVMLRRPLIPANFQKWVGTFEPNGLSTDAVMEALRGRPFPWTGSALLAIDGGLKRDYFKGLKVIKPSLA